MYTQKLSISLPENQYASIEGHDVIKKAIRLLQKAQLESCYHEANQEINDDFDLTTLDGIEENEPW